MREHLVPVGDMNSDQDPPTVSFVVPTLNAARTLRVCLQSVFSQQYPPDKMELLVVDGGSTDSTLAIAREFPCRVLSNPYRYEEGPGGGKSIGFQDAGGDIVVFLDSDNELGSPQWLMNTVLPYSRRKDIVGTFSHLVPKADGGGLSRYLTKANPQPSIRFWKPEDVVRLPIEHSGFRIVKLNAACDLSNGASVRRDVLRVCGGYDYGLETTKRLIDAGYSTFAWPGGTDVYHHFVGVTLRQLVRKRISRLRRFKAWEGQGLRSYTITIYRPTSGDEYLRLWARVIKSMSLLTVPEAAWRTVRDRDSSWLYHPVVSFLDTGVHILLLWELVLRIVGQKRGSRPT